MPKPKEKKQNNQGDPQVKISKENRSSLAEFIKRPLATENELEQFDRYLAGSATADDRTGRQEQARAEAIEDSISEIYQDEDGAMINVKKLEIKSRRGIVFWFFLTLFGLLGLIGASLAAYYYFYLPGGSDSLAVELAIEGKRQAMTGEEFFYTITYKNLDRVAIKDIEIKLTYPDNFVYLDSDPLPGERNDTWRLPQLAPRRSGKITIKGKLIGSSNSVNIVLAGMTYTPLNFSSVFKKSTSQETVISGSGLNLELSHASTAFVGQENEIILTYRQKEDSYINNFQLAIAAPENFEFIKPDNNDEADYLGPALWQIKSVSREPKQLKIKFTVKEKQPQAQELIFKFNYGEDEASSRLFAEEKISFEVSKSDFNINLIINGSAADQGVDFGQTLNYSIFYANKGEVALEDVIIMAVLESDSLNWAALDDKNRGREFGNTISWSKEEIPGLNNIARGEQGTINFSIKVTDQGEFDLTRDYQVKSYVQYGVGGREIDGQDQDSRSNVIVNKINSNLGLDEQLRYFSDDNIAVGSGPLPPRVGETTSYKVYWVITNNLHELNDLQITVNLPDYVSWDDKNRSAVGSLAYDQASHSVTWQIGRLPISVYRLEAEFNISITPPESARDKIMVLLPGSTITAADNETRAAISKKTKAKTSRLEDDEIADSDGRVR